METNKKVLYVATVASHIKSFHLPYLKMLHEMGYKTYVAANWNLGDGEKLNYCDEFYQIPIQRSPYSSNNLKAIKELKKIIDKEQFDIIHCHTPMGAVVARLAAKKARKKYGTRVIYTAHGFHFFKGAPLLNWSLFYPVEWYLSKYTDTLITINHEDEELAKNKFSKRCKDIQYIPGVGIDEEKFNFEMIAKEKKELRESLGLKENDFVMIYPAEISKRKRQEWLINTLSSLMKEHSDIHLLLPGKDSLSGKCQKLTKDLNLENQIHFLGFRKDIPKLLKISNLALSSATQEGLPVNIMEAMYVGLPIVASDCRGNRDLVEDEKNGYLIEIEGKKRFVKCITKLMKSETEREKFSENGKKKINDYLLEKTLNKMKEIYFSK